MMGLLSICFSPTGGTRNAAEQLCAGWTEKPAFVDLTNAAGGFAAVALTAQDVCVISVPSYGGRVPAVACERIALLRGNGAAAVLLVSFGNRAYDDTLLELQDTVTACGFRVLAAVAAVTEHSIMRQFATGRPDAADTDELRGFGAQIQQALQNTGDAATLALPGNRPFRAYGGVPLKPKTDNHCTRCGTCANGCPVSAIPLDDPKQTDDHACISCMRCISVCPVHARSLNKVVLFAASVKLKSACADRKANTLFLAQ